MSDLQLVSLFDGIAGFPHAFSQAGVRTVATVEIDKAAAGVAAEHFPDAARFHDVTKVTGADLLAAGFDPVRGIISAGWPCTDLSLAGLRLGLGGARSGLVGEVFRLLLELRPRWFVLENVPGLLSSVCPCPGGGVCSTCADDPHTVRGGSCGRRVRAGLFTGTGRCMALHGGGMGTVLRRLGECGYGICYRILDAQHFGVPQRRRRVVIVGHLGDAAGPVEVLLEPECGTGHPAAGGAARPGAAAGAGRGAAVAGLVANALTSNMAGGGGGADDNTAQGGHLVFQHQGFDASEDGTGRGTPIVPIGFGETGGIGVGEDVSPSVRTGTGGGRTSVVTAAVRRLTPVECERLQGYPDGWTAVSAGRPQADSARYRQLGNSIAVPVFAWVARRMVAVDGGSA